MPHRLVDRARTQSRSRARSRRLRAIARALALGCALAAGRAAVAQSSSTESLFPIRWHWLNGPSEDASEFVLDDWNRDGHTDVLARYTAGWRLALADGAGEFAPSVQVGVEQPVGDLDGDGAVDLVRAFATSPTTTTVNVKLSDGAGGFAALAPQVLAGNVYINATVARGGDVNGDGNLDVYLVGLSLPQVIALMGDGTGGFTNVNGATTNVSPMVAALADLDGDGVSDYLAGTESGNPDHLLFVRGLGDGAFAPPALAGTCNTPRQLDLADFDVDGDLDLVVSQLSNVPSTYHAGWGNGGFEPGAPLAGAPGLSVSTTSVLVADHDLDGIDDVVLANGTQLALARFGWFRGAAGSAPQAYQPFGYSLLANVVRRVDLDDDGEPEWVGAAVRGLVAVREHGPQPVMATNAGTVSSTGGWAACTTTTDLDADGRLDLAVAGYNSSPAPGGGVLYTYRGAANGSFALVDVDALAKPTASDIAAADFDSDGRADLVVSLSDTQLAASRIQSYCGSGDGHVSACGSAAFASELASLVAADIDADGRADLVCGLSDYDAFDLGLGAQLGDGAGGFTPSWESTFPVGSFSSAPQPAFVGDVDEDGMLDAVTRGAASQQLALWRGNGAGGFAAPQHVDVLPAIEALDGFALHDENADGHLDLVASSIYGLRACDGDGSGAFAPSAVLFTTTDVAVGALAFADVDRDGVAELLGESVFNLGPLGSRTRVFARGDAGWSPHGIYAYTGRLRDHVRTDVDADGVLDFASLLESVSLWMPGVPELADGLAAYGAGTPSCAGAISAVANVAPRVGASDFALSWTNAPANASALVGIAFTPDVTGTDVFGVGVNLHIGLLGPVLAYSIASDASGAAKLAFPIPDVPALAGFEAFTQALWIEPAWQSCSSSPLPWSSSRGLAITVLP